MSRHQAKSRPVDPPITEDDIQGALRVFQSLEAMKDRSPTLAELVPGRARSAALAKRIRSARITRNAIFEDGLFAEPAWDILLSLYVSMHEGYRMTVSAVCNESGVAHTTALRWIERLIDSGLVRRRRNNLDNRSSFVELEPEAIHKMDRLLDQLSVGTLRND